MLPITLEPQQQINLFPKHSNNAFNFELEVVNKGLSAEIRLYFLTSKKKKLLDELRKNLFSNTKLFFCFSTGTFTQSIGLLIVEWIINEAPEACVGEILQL